MHTFISGDTKFNFNSDFSGDLVIIREDMCIPVPFTAALAFAEEVFRRLKLSAQDDSSDQPAAGNE
jgi:hypothetical protein